MFNNRLRRGLLERIAGIVLVVCALSAFASGQTPDFRDSRNLDYSPRLDYSHPVAGGELSVVVDRVAPYSPVELWLSDTHLESRIADASGCARFSYPVPHEIVGQDAVLRAIVNDATVNGTGQVELPIRFSHPSLLVTGVRDGSSWLVRVDVTGNRSVPFVPYPAVRLGSGRPGSAVRNSRGTKTFVMADVDAGRVMVVPDAPTVPVGHLQLPPNLRDIVATPDGRFVLVSSAGATTSNGASSSISFLSVLDAETDQVVGQALLEPFGADGGSIVATEDGQRAFVSVDGLYLQEVELRDGADARRLVAVGGPGQDRIKDVRVVDGFLFALTASGDRLNYLTGLALADLNQARLEGPSRNGNFIGLGTVANRKSLLVMDGPGGEVRAFDVRTMSPGGVVKFAPGADALLLTPDPSGMTAAIVYSDPETSSVFPVDLRNLSLGTGREIGLLTSSLPVRGHSGSVRWFFLAHRSGEGGLVALEPMTLDPRRVEGVGMVVHALSIDG